MSLNELFKLPKRVLKIYSYWEIKLLRLSLILSDFYPNISVKSLKNIPVILTSLVA
jgi:hypothetical protein